MNPDKIVIRFDQVAEQTEGPVKRVVGFVRAKNMLQLFDAADLEANPREAKAGAVTADIIESIRGTPDTFPFKTKGILVGASNYQPLQRNRYELRFENTKIEGILDGGHNMLAIGTHILAMALGDDRLLRRIKNWSQMKEMWEETRKAVDVFKASDQPNGDALSFLIPLEVLVPSDLENDEAIAEFNRSLLDICAARNNNVELKLETKANQKGYYEHLRKALPREIANRVEWKTNDGGDIKVRDLIALAWIPLSVIELPEDLKHIRVLPQNIYRNKGECVKLFDELMSHKWVSKPTGGEYRHELHNTTIGSALALAAELPKLYDKIYINFPVAYNSDNGRFGRLAVVKMADDMRSKPTTHFTEQEVEYAYPDGLIMPLVYGLKALMEVGQKGLVRWKEDPETFIDGHLGGVVKKYRVIMDAFRADPNKIGKHEGAYELVIDAVETERLKRQAAS
jgi:hypothetical protein